MTGNSSEPPLASAAHEKHSLGSLEEDDEFEEFLAEDWTAQQQTSVQNNQAENTQQWTSSWDDDDLQEDFSQQLRAQLEMKH